MNIIYEDNHILVVEKPCNIASQGDDTGDKDLLTMCKEYLKEKYNKPGNVYCGLVHRLDRPVGGIMVFAKTSKAASRLSESIRTNNFHKTYLAVVVDNNDNLKNKSTLQDYMIKNEALNKSMVCDKNKKGSKEAILDYEVIEKASLDKPSIKNIKLVKINLKTGRHHQIRVQFSSRGYPLYGDQKYGSGPKGEQIALWAYKITFKHPTKDEEMTFECKPKNYGIWSNFSIESI
ncbi:MAG: RluA family pseudouridine synthase [Clostridia bacterium]|nr:RluA family pseudouridine synthase [Clostridia bacterium]